MLRQHVLEITMDLMIKVQPWAMVKHKVWFSRFHIRSMWQRETHKKQGISNQPLISFGSYGFDS
jgi:hypothetical protein